MSIKLLLALLAALLLRTALAAAQPSSPFPPAEPQSVGISASALQSLDAAVKGYIERQEAVGAELLIIKNRKTVWHAAYGLRDVQSKAPMEIGGIFCVRSQTKPLVGTAIQMLIDEGKLALDDHAAKFLQEFDSDSHRSITVKNLLEHRGGLKLSSLLATNHKTLKSVQDVVTLASRYKLESEPGTTFNYSDDGTDTLAAIIEKVSGVPVAEFIDSRIIKPLGMHDTMCVLRPGDERVSRVNSNHAGSVGGWSRFWSPSDPPLFPYFLGSQSLYSTCEDYARFLCLWADGGTVGAVRLLSGAAVERGLHPASEMDSSTGFRDQDAWYGQLWQTLVTPGQAGSQPTRVAFGHSGSDGTSAWMWPERDLIVLYFTQSRGGLTTISLQSEVERLLIRGEEAEATSAAALRNLAGLSGLYWDEENERVWSVSPVGEKLRVEMQGKTVLDLVRADQELWKFELQPRARVKFESGSDGVAMRMVASDAGGSRTLTRLIPSPELPDIEEVEALVQSAHHMEKLVKPIRREGTLKMPARGIDTTYVEILAKGKSLSDLGAGSARTRLLVRDGEVWVRQGAAQAQEMTGLHAAQSLFQRAEVTFGGWRTAGADAQVLKRVEDEGRTLLLVRLRPPEGHASLLYIEESTGRVVRQDQLVMIPGMATAVGLQTRFEEFEDVGGVLLPRQTTSAYVTPLLGKGETTFSTQAVIEEGVDPFTIEDE